MGNLRYFFTYGAELPSGVGFGMFTAAHFTWLAAGAIVIFVLALRYKGLSKQKRRHADKAAGWFLVALMAVRALYLVIVGYQTVYEVPLHLCSLAGFLCLLHSYKPYDWAGQTLYTLCLPGTLAALIFADWNYYPTIHFITIAGFL